MSEWAKLNAKPIVMRRELVWSWLGWTEESTEETQNVSIRYLFISASGGALEKKYELLKGV